MKPKKKPTPRIPFKAIDLAYLKWAEGKRVIFPRDAWARGAVWMLERTTKARKDGKQT